LGIDNVDNLFKIKSNLDFSGPGHLVLNQNGFLGIGVQAPTASIHLPNEPSNKKILLYDINGNLNQFTGFGTEANGTLRYQVDRLGADHIFYSGSTSNSSTELMRIKGSGKIGINEANPTTARLAVNTGNVDEFGLSLITSLGNGKGAGIEFDNKGVGGKNYCIYNGNNQLLNIYDKTTNQVFFQVGLSGTNIIGNQNTTGNQNIIGNQSITGNQNITGSVSISGGRNGGNIFIDKNAGPTGDHHNASVEIRNGSTAQGGSLIILNKKNSLNQDNQWYSSVERDGIFRIAQNIVDGSSNNSNVKLMIDKTKTEVNGNMNVTGRIKEKGNDLLPVGTILPYAGSSPPAGFLLCNGQYCLRGNYSDLYAVIQLTYTPSGYNDSTQFRIPDLRCRVPVGVGDISLGVNMTPKTLASASGSETHTLTIAEMPSHSHGTTVPINYFDADDDSDGLYRLTWENTKNGQTGNVGSNQPHNIMQPYLVINYIIKY
jgi:microcystin-dependent protein